MSRASETCALMKDRVVLGFTGGVVVGAATGLLEVVCHWVGGSRVITRQFLFPAMVVYGVVWGLLGAGLGLARTIRQTRTRPGDDAETAWGLAFLIGSALILLIGGYVNTYWLPSFTSLRSLMFDGALIGGVWWVARGIGVRWLTRRVAWSRRTGWVRTLGGRLGGPAVVAVVLLATYLPDRRAGGAAGVNAGLDVPCNVVLIVMDAVRADHLSADGYQRPTSPNLATLAKRGVLFHNAMANSSWTHASIPTLLTSVYPSTHQVNRTTSALPPSIPTVPQLLKQTGMATAIFSSNTFVTPLFGFGQGVDRFVHYYPGATEQLILGHVARKLLTGRPTVREKAEAALHRFDKLLNPKAATSIEEASADTLNRAFLTWVKQTRPRRFFAYLHYMETHAPYDPPEAYRTRFMSGPVDGALREQVFAVRGVLPFQRGKPLAPAQRQQVIALYDAEINQLDEALGRLFQALEALGLADETLIIVTADHGEEFFEHGGWGHGHSLHHELLHVPLIISYPARLPMGRVVETRVSLVDVAPTILELCGVPSPPFQEGQSVVPLMVSEDAAVEDRVVYSELYHDGGMSVRALMQGPYKLIVAEEASQRQVALYNTREDPTETRDVSTRFPERVSSLLNALEQRTRSASAKSRGIVTLALDERTQERLRALGYLQ